MHALSLCGLQINTADYHRFTANSDKQLILIISWTPRSPDISGSYPVSNNYPWLLHSLIISDTTHLSEAAVRGIETSMCYTSQSLFFFNFFDLVWKDIKYCSTNFTNRGNPVILFAMHYYLSTFSSDYVFWQNSW